MTQEMQASNGWMSRAELDAMGLPLRWDDGAEVKMRRSLALPEPLWTNLTSSTVWAALEVAVEFGWEVRTGERDPESGYVSIEGRAAVKDFCDALRRAYPVLRDTRPAPIEEDGGPGTGRATFIGPNVNVSGLVWLAGARVRAVQAMIAVCSWALAQPAPASDDLWISFV